MFLEISQNSQENTCARSSFLIKFQAKFATLLKKRLWHRSFPVNFCEMCKNTFSYRAPPEAVSARILSNLWTVLFDLMDNKKNNNKTNVHHNVFFECSISLSQSHQSVSVLKYWEKQFSDDRILLETEHSDEQDKRELFDYDS